MKLKFLAKTLWYKAPGGARSMEAGTVIDVTQDDLGQTPDAETINAWLGVKVVEVVK